MGLVAGACNETAGPQPCGSPETLEGYACHCAEALGSLEPWSCLDGDVIPVTRDGVSLDLDDPDYFATCDRPAWLLPNGCLPNARVGRLEARGRDGRPLDGVQWVYICRHVQPRGSGETTFENVALIGHDPESGATCFFQGPHVSSTDTARIPPPDEPPNATPDGAPKAADFWGPTAEAVLGERACLRCHDADPWIHSPYVDQVPDVVPFPALGDPPYYDLRTGLAPPSILPAANACTTCHPVGTEESCASFLAYMTGRAHPARTTPSFSEWPFDRPMPPFVAETTDEATWKAAYGPAVDALAACCEAPESYGCGLRPERVVALPAGMSREVVRSGMLDATSDEGGEP